MWAALPCWPWVSLKAPLTSGHKGAQGDPSLGKREVGIVLPTPKIKAPYSVSPLILRQKECNKNLSPGAFGKVKKSHHWVSGWLSVPPLTRPRSVICISVYRWRGRWLLGAPSQLLEAWCVSVSICEVFCLCCFFVQVDSIFTGPQRDCFIASVGHSHSVTTYKVLWPPAAKCFASFFSQLETTLQFVCTFRTVKSDWVLSWEGDLCIRQLGPQRGRIFMLGEFGDIALVPFATYLLGWELWLIA